MEIERTNVIERTNDIFFNDDDDDDDDDDNFGRQR